MFNDKNYIKLFSIYSQYFRLHLAHRSLLNGDQETNMGGEKSLNNNLLLASNFYSSVRRFYKRLAEYKVPINNAIACNGQV